MRLFHLVLRHGSPRRCCSPTAPEPKLLRHAHRLLHRCMVPNGDIISVASSPALLDSRFRLISLLAARSLCLPQSPRVHSRYRVSLSPRIRSRHASPIRRPRAPSSQPSSTAAPTFFTCRERRRCGGSLRYCHSRMSYRRM